MTFDLQRVVLFQGLTGCDATAVLAAARQKDVPQGSCFFHQADQANSCHLLIGGEVRLIQGNSAGAQVIVRFVAPGEVFGWPSLLGAPTYPGSAEAVVDSSALVWDEAALREMMLAQPRLALNALEMVGARLHEMQDRLSDLATEPASRRVARMLLRLARQRSRPLGQEVEIAFPLSRQDLADATGSTLHTVSRILAAWKDEGLLRGARRRVIISRPDALEKLAEGD